MSEFKRYKYVDTIPRTQKVRRLVWSIAYSIFFRTTPRGMMNGWRIAMLRLFGAQIGKGSKVAPTCFVWAPWNLVMGELSVLGDHVDCYTMNRVVIGSKVAVSQRSFLCTGSHDTTSLLRPLTTAPIHIGDHVWIAAEAMIAPGVTLGEGAVIGARSLINKDVEPWMIYAGNPGTPIRQRQINSNPEAVGVKSLKPVGAK